MKKRIRKKPNCVRQLINIGALFTEITFIVKSERADEAINILQKKNNIQDIKGNYIFGNQYVKIVAKNT